MDSKIQNFLINNYQLSVTGYFYIGKIMVFANLGWYGGELTDDGLLSPEGADEKNEGSSLFDSFVQKAKSALASIGLVIKNGMVNLKELIAEKIIAKFIKTEIIDIQKLQIRDQVTGDIYCAWIENGEWQKIKGECGAEQPPVPEVCDSNHLNLCQNETDCTVASGYWYGEVCNSGPQTPVCTSNWQCDGWQPAVDTIVCGENFSQTQTCTDLNNCGINEGKPAEQQEATGTQNCQPQPEPELQPELIPEPQPAPELQPEVAPELQPEPISERTETPVPENNKPEKIISP